MKNQRSNWLFSPWPLFLGILLTILVFAYRCSTTESEETDPAVFEQELPSRNQ